MNLFGKGMEKRATHFGTGAAAAEEMVAVDQKPGKITEMILKVSSRPRPSGRGRRSFRFDPAPVRVSQRVPMPNNYWRWK
jgi:hypothetical protein